MTRDDDSEAKIEKGVPLPPARGEGISKYPFDKLEVGDSFFIEDDFESAGKNPASRAAGIASAAGKRLGRKFTTRRVDGGVRIWRTA